ncbi:MAG: helix-turn-helix domain-containing protein [Solirubrobacterales bacterium]
MSRYDQQQAPGIGATLKDARRRLGMDIKEAEDRTKIRTRYLRALEAEDWEVLPAPAYVRGFLRTYGQILGLDGEALADRYRRSFEEPASAAPPEPVIRNRRANGSRRAPGSRPPSRSGPIVAIGAGVVILLIVLAIIGLTSGGDDESPSGQKPAGKGKAKASKQVSKPDKSSSKPIDFSIEPLASTRICLVGGGEALIDSQVLAVGATEQFTGEKSYRLDLIGGGSVKVDAGGDEEKLEPGDDATYEADADGIREVTYAGPDCP